MKLPWQIAIVHSNPQFGLEHIFDDVIQAVIVISQLKCNDTTEIDIILITVNVSVDIFLYHLPQPKHSDYGKKKNYCELLCEQFHLK